MTTRRFRQIGVTVLSTVVMMNLLTLPALAQTVTSVRVIAIAVVLENPRGDSVVLGTVEPGELLEVLDQQGGWYFVRAPEGTDSWRRGWVADRFVEVLGATPPDPSDSPVSLQNAVRGFAQLGGNFFAADNSFETVVGSQVGFIYGGGVHVAFGRLFVQGSVERYEETGERVFVFEDEVFELGLSSTVTMTPIHISVGYRQAANSSLIGYLGGGISWYMYKEEAAFADPQDNVDVQELGYHVMGGVETPILPWFWLGGEFQWAYVPNVLGDQGVSALFEEDNLGGFTVRLKLSFGY
jgi:hypothetical protein